jgi:hypothetical protein
MKKNSNRAGEKTVYCKSIISGCNNTIIAKNNVNSLNFSNITRTILNADRLASGAPRFVTGLTVYGNIGENPGRYISPQVYTQDIKNGIQPNIKIKQYYVTQSLRLSLLSR